MRDSRYMDYDPSPGMIGDSGASIVAILIIAIIVVLVIFLFSSASSAKKKKDDAVSDVKKILDKMIDDAKTFGRAETVPPLESAQKQVTEYIAKNWPDP